MSNTKITSSQYWNRWRAWPIFLIIIGYAFLYVILIHSQSFVHHGDRVFPLHDDAMISMRYAQQISLEHGPVWNEGERVQGYTNFLWMMYMTIPHLLKFGLYRSGLFVQVSNMIINVTIFAIVWRSTRKRSSIPIATTAVLLLVVSLPFTYWALAGFETSLQALFVTLALITFFQQETSARSDNSKSTFISFVLIGISYLIRPDSLVLLFVVILIQLIRFLQYRRIEILPLIGMVICISLIISLHVFQLKYYGDILPNTFYLKMTEGARSDAFFYLLRMSPDSLFFLFIAIIINAVIMRTRQWIEIASIPISYIIYIFLTGGDVFGFSRYFVSIIPFTCIFSSIALSDIAHRISKMTGHKKNHILSIMIAILVIFSFSKLNLFFANIARNRQAAHDQLLIAESLKNLLESDDLIAVAWAGALPYFIPEYRFLDVHGKNDRYIAHTTAHPGPPVGHNKWDLSYILEERRPNAIVAGGYVPYGEHPEFVKRYQTNWVLVPGTKEVQGFWLRDSR